MSNKKRDPIREKREYRISMESACKMYNAGLNQLTSIACHKAPNDDNVAKIRETLRAVLVADDTIVIIQSGPYIWKYREQIAKKDEHFFLLSTFNDDINNVISSNKAQNFTNNDIATVMTSIKSTYSSMTKPEQETIWTHVMNLLRSYAQYIGAERKLKEVEEEIRRMQREK